MERTRFDEYIARFNAQDLTALDDFIAEDLDMVNGTLRIRGRDGMKDHYRLIWADFTEALTVENFVSNDEHVAIRMWAHFTATRDNPEALFGPVSAGDCFDFRGLILYWLDAEGRFERIQVAYNSFSSTPLGGATVELGIPH